MYAADSLVCLQRPPCFLAHRPIDDSEIWEVVHRRLWGTRKKVAVLIRWAGLGAAVGFFVKLREMESPRPRADRCIGRLRAGLQDAENLGGAEGFEILMKIRAHVRHPQTSFS